MAEATSEPVVLFFQDQMRIAAQHLLDNTPLGVRLPMVADVRDDGQLLTITAHPGDLLLSSGELRLWSFLCSLDGRALVDISDVLRGVDENCAFACWWALGISIGRATSFSIPAMTL